MCWSLYCASVANAFSDPGSFDDFLKKLKNPAVQGGEKTESGMNDKQVRKQLDGAGKLLNGFVPPMKGGNGP